MIMKTDMCFAELDDEFLAIASQVPTDYMDEAGAMNGETTMSGLNNLNDLLAALNTCIRWIAWIGGLLLNVKKISLHDYMLN